MLAAPKVGPEWNTQGCLSRGRSPGRSPTRGATFGAMRPSAWAVFALCLLGSTCGTTTTAAEIGFDYVVSTVVLNTVVGSMNKISTVSRQIGAMCANALHLYSYALGRADPTIQTHLPRPLLRPFL